MLYGMNEFVKLLHLESRSRENFFGFILKTGGVWLPSDDDDRYRQTSTRELAEIFAGFEGQDFSKPVLAFPCTRPALREFLKKSGLDGMVHKPTCELYSDEPDLTPGVNELPAEYVERLSGEIQKQDVDDRKAIIAVGLINHLHQTGAGVVDLLYPGKYNSDQHAAKKTEGSRIKARGNAILLKNKKEG